MNSDIVVIDGGPAGIISAPDVHPLVTAAHQALAKMSAKKRA